MLYNDILEANGNTPLIRLNKEGAVYNADTVGAYNILRKYSAASDKQIDMPVSGLSNTETIKVAV